MPIYATANRKGKDGIQNIFNTMEFTIVKVGDSTVTVHGEDFPINSFKELFVPSYCSTVYKYQGLDISHVEYNMFDVQNMDSKMLYTALSRVKLNFRNIHLDHKSLKKQYTIRKQSARELCNSYFNTLYLKGKIYEVSFAKSDRVYVRSICRELVDRPAEHKANPNSAIYKHKRQKPCIKLLALAPSKDKRALQAVVTEYIAEYSRRFGNRLLNKRQTPKPKKELKKKSIAA